MALRCVVIAVVAMSIPVVAMMSTVMIVVVTVVAWGEESVACVVVAHVCEHAILDVAAE